MYKLILVDETEIESKNGFSVVDDTYEYTTTMSDYTELATLSSKFTDENLSTVTVVDNWGGEVEYSGLTVSVPRFFIVEENGYEIIVTIRLKTKTTVDDQIQLAQNVAQDFDDEKALTVKSLYPNYTELIGKQVSIGTKCVWYEKLYKTKIPDYTVTKDLTPGSLGSEAIWECIDEDHEGTYEDPIPYEGNMTLEQGKFYTQNDIIYICTNGSGIAVYDNLEYLVTFVAEYVYAEGTFADPIPWNSGLILEQGKYYIQNSIIYECYNGSGIGVYGDLKDLAAFVKVYEPVVLGETPENPLPYYDGMILQENTYYIQNGVIYKCIVSSESAVTGDLSTLSDYVEVYTPDSEGDTPTEPEEPDVDEPPKTGSGESKEDPIVWSKGSKLYNGSYYIDKDVVYLCIRDSGIEMYYDLADLISGGYVKVAE